MDIELSDEFTLKPRFEKFINKYPYFTFKHRVLYWFWWRWWRVTMIHNETGEIM